jgi:hypothetical protein
MRADDEATPQSLPFDEDEDRGPLLGGVQDAVRRMLVTGVGTLFMTEEGIRSMVKELKLPKEALGFVLAQADKTKSEVTRVVGAELRKFLESTRLREDLLELIGQLTLEVDATIQIRRRRPGEPGVIPHVSARVGRGPAKARPRRKARA